jgi:HSP20 family protein
MALGQWDPFTTLARLDTDFDEFVRRAWGTPAPTARSGRARTSGYVPAVEMRTDGADVVIMLELPGLDIDRDVEIEVDQNRLSISGERRDTGEQQDDSRRTLVRELRYGSFRREFALPEGVTADDVEAHYDRGMLQLRVRNVAKPVVPPQKIPIRSADTPAAPRTIEGTTVEGAAERT